MEGCRGGPIDGGDEDGVVEGAGATNCVDGGLDGTEEGDRVGDVVRFVHPGCEREHDGGAKIQKENAQSKQNPCLICVLPRNLAPKSRKLDMRRSALSDDLRKN